MHHIKTTGMVHKPQLLEFLKEKQACVDALTWIASTPGTPAELWQSCPRGDWLLWLCGQMGVDRRLLVRAAVGCAYPALVYLPAGEERPRRALDAALSWCEGGASIEEARAAAAAAAGAAGVGIYAADAAYAAAYAVVAAAGAAAYAAAYAAADAAAGAGIYAIYARQKSLAHSADTVRRHIQFPAAAQALGGVICRTKHNYLNSLKKRDFNRL